MKRAKLPRASDAGAEDSAAVASPSPSSSAVSSTKRRRNNPDECCVTCKLRKVKCSGKSGDDPCDNCCRLKLKCSFTHPLDGSQPADKVARITPNGTVTEAGTLRKRAQRACQQCHVHKTKCSGDLPRCARCQLNDLPCEYTPSKRKFANLPGKSSAATTPTPNGGPITPDEDVPQNVVNESRTTTVLESGFALSPSFQDQLLKREVLLKHADVYFEHLFHMPCMGFLHPGTIYRLINEEKLPPALAAGICSITADLVSPGATGRALAQRCNEQLEFFTLRHCGFMTADYLVYHLLATLYNWMSGPLAKVWMWSATASRLIKCLQLNYEPDLRTTQLTYPEREIQRRSVWQIYIIDHFLSGGHDEHLLLPSSSIHIRLPCSDQVFKDELPSAMETFNPNSTIPPGVGDYSLDACHVRLLTIRSQVLRATKRFTDFSQGQMSDPMRPEQFMEHVNQYQTALYRFTDSLPEHLKLSVSNVDAHILQPNRPSYTMLHTWYCQTHIELYSFSLHALKQATSPDSVPWEFFLRSHRDFLFRSQQQAVSYAICLAQTWEYSLQNIKKHPSTTLKTGLVTVDWMIGACAVDVVEVLLAARKYKLYKNLRGNTSAQMCYLKPIDDDLLATLIANIVKLVGDLAAYLPRVEHYRTTIVDKIKEFEDDISTNGYREAFKDEEQGTVSSSTSLPGPDNIMSQNQLDATVSPRSLGDTSSLSDKFLRKKSVSHHDKALSLNGVSQIGDLPVMPYCLRQAQDSSLDGPFAPPTTGSYSPAHLMDVQQQQQSTELFNTTLTAHVGPFFDGSFRSALPIDPTMQSHITYNQPPVPDISQSIPPSMQPHSNDSGLFVPYGANYFPGEQSQTPWIEQGERSSHVYS